MSVCAKFQLSSWSRSAWKVCCGVVGWGGVGNTWVLCLTQRSCFYSCFGLSWVELSWVEAELGNIYICKSPEFSSSAHCQIILRHLWRLINDHSIIITHSRSYGKVSYDQIQEYDDQYFYPSLTCLNIVYIILTTICQNDTNSVKILEKCNGQCFCSRVFVQRVLLVIVYSILV